MHLNTGNSFRIFFLIIGSIICSYSQSVDIFISPREIYLNANTTVTCQVVVDNSTLLSLVPFFIINGTYVQHSCIGDPDYLPLTQRFTPLPFFPTTNSTLAIKLSFIPVNSIDDRLSLGCGFYDLVTNNFSMSNITSLTIRTPVITQTSSAPNNSNQTIPTVEVLILLPFTQTQSFYIIIGTVGGVLLLVIGCTIILIVLVVVIVAVQKRKGRKPKEPVVLTEVLPALDPSAISNPMLHVKEDDDLRNRADSVKTYTETEASRYSALPTYSIAVNNPQENFADSMAVTHPTSFSSIEVDEKKEDLS